MIFWIDKDRKVLRCEFDQPLIEEGEFMYALEMLALFEDEKEHLTYSEKGP